MAWWIFQSLVIASALALLVQIVARAGRLGPVARHALWVVVLIKLMTPPLVAWPWAITQPQRAFTWLAETWDADPRIPVLTSFQRHDDAQAAPLAAAVLPLSPPPSDRRPVTPPAPLPSPARVVESPREDHHASDAASPAWTPSWIELAAMVWLAGAFVMLLVHGVRIRRMFRMVRGSSPADAALVARIAHHARDLDVRAIDVRVVDDLDSPVIWAFRRARLLWPAGMAANDASIDGLIVHELAHLKRRDHAIGWVELAGAVVWWWNPLFWYVRYQIRENAELACDAWVVDTLPAGRRAYAEALLAVCAGTSGRAMPMPAVGIRSSGRRFLERRLTVIMRDRVPLRLPRLGFVCVVMLAAAAVPTLAQQNVSTLPVRILTAPPEIARPAPQSAVAITSSFDAQQTSAPPADLTKVADTFAQNEAAVLKDAEAKIARYRQETIQQLQAMQDAHTRAGRLDEAIAVRDYIRQLQRQDAGKGTVDAALVDADRQQVTTISHHEILGNPGDLQRFHGRIGETLYVTVTGAGDGPLWGTDVYTDDSSLAGAAVHAGVLKPGETGVVRVMVLPGMPHYEGSNRNGLRSTGYEEWTGSFRVLPATGPVPEIAMAFDRPGRVNIARADVPPIQVPPSIRGRVGASTTLEVTGAVDGPVWGTDVYTDDSSVAVAAVHAGLLRPGEHGRVKVTLLPGQDHYEGSVRNGVRTSPYETWGGSFRLERVDRQTARR